MSLIGHRHLHASDRPASARYAGDQGVRQYRLAAAAVRSTSCLTRTFMGVGVGTRLRRDPAEPVSGCARDGVALGARGCAAERGGAHRWAGVHRRRRARNSPRRRTRWQIGVDLETALLDMAERNDISEYRFFATALALQSQTGGGLTETLETLADTIRKRENARKAWPRVGVGSAHQHLRAGRCCRSWSRAMLFVINPEYIGTAVHRSAPAKCCWASRSAMLK